MRTIRLTGPARHDISAALATSNHDFGTVARQRYEALIVAALRDIAADPFRMGSRELPARPGLRAYHLSNSRKHAPEPGVRNPRHIVIYRMREPDTVTVLRLLHDAMDPSLHLP